MSLENTLIGGLFFVAIGLIIMFYGWRQNKNIIVMKLGIIPMVLSSIVTFLSLSYSDAFYEAYTPFWIAFSAIALLFILFKISQDVLRETENDC